MGLLALGHERAIPLTEPDLGRPAAGWDRGGALCQAPWPVSTALGRIPLGPGPCAQGTTGMVIPGLGQAALRTPPPTGIC
jgi:hypothetical protein